MTYFCVQGKQWLTFVEILVFWIDIDHTGEENTNTYIPAIVLYAPMVIGLLQPLKCN